MKTTQTAKQLIVGVAFASFAFGALAGNDEVKTSGSNGIMDTKTGTVETTGTSAATTGTDANMPTGNLGTGAKHGTQTGEGK